MGRKVAPPRTRRALLEEIEPRLLLSADLGPLPPVLATVADAPAPAPLHADLGTDPTPAARSETTAPGSAHPRREVVFVDTSTPDYRDVVRDLTSRPGDGRDVDVILLDGSRDGIDQISAALERYRGLDAIHVVSHGADGMLALGSTRLDLDSVLADAKAIAGWGRSLNVGADLLIYGCDFAAHADGQALARSLAALTGADVAASENPTGNAALGGDWVLEYHSGAIDTGDPFSAGFEAQWLGLLATNQPPVNTVPGAQTVAPDTSLVFSTANGNLVSVSDVDAGTSPVQVTLAATNGTLTLARTTGLTFGTGTGTGDATMTFTGTLTDINAALDGLAFDPSANFNGAASVQITTDDLGNSGSGGVLSDSDSIAITVGAVNDPPVLSANGGAALNAGDTTIIDSAHLAATDVDNSAAQILYALTAAPAHGTLRLNGAVLGVNDTFTQADIDTNRVSYQNDGSANATDGFTFVITDGAGGTLPAATFNVSVNVPAPSAPAASPAPPALPPVSTSPVNPPDPVPPPPADSATPEAPSVENAPAREPTGHGGDTTASEGDVAPSPEGAAALEAAASPAAPAAPAANQPSAPAPAVASPARAAPPAPHAQAPKPGTPAGTAPKGGHAPRSPAATPSPLAHAPLRRALDAFSEQRAQAEKEYAYRQHVAIGAVTGVTGALTAGYLVWVLRAGSLVASLLSTIPLWKGFDPLPILAHRTHEEDLEPERDAGEEHEEADPRVAGDAETREDASVVHILDPRPRAGAVEFTTERTP